MDVASLRAALDDSYVTEIVCAPGVYAFSNCHSGNMCHMEFLAALEIMSGTTTSVRRPLLRIVAAQPGTVVWDGGSGSAGKRPLVEVLVSAHQQVEIVGIRIRGGYSRVWAGGGVSHSGGALTLRSCVLEHNAAFSDNADGGGALVTRGRGNVTLVDCTLTRNVAFRGGAILTLPDAGFGTFIGHPSVTLVSCNLTHNKAGMGGAVAALAGAVLMVDCTLADNEATAHYLDAPDDYCCGGDDVGELGGALLVGRYSTSETAGAATLRDCLLQRNSAFFGGGLFVEAGIARLRSSVVADNWAKAGGDGGGILAGGGTLFLSDSTTVVGNRVRGTHAAAGHNIVPSATVYYEFPTPPGHWLPNAECRVYREPCPVVSRVALVERPRAAAPACLAMVSCGACLLT